MGVGWAGEAAPGCGRETGAGRSMLQQAGAWPQAVRLTADQSCLRLQQHLTVRPCYKALFALRSAEPEPVCGGQLADAISLRPGLIEERPCHAFCNVPAKLAGTLIEHRLNHGDAPFVTDWLPWLPSKGHHAWLSAHTCSLSGSLDQFLCLCKVARTKLRLDQAAGRWCSSTGWQMPPLC